MLTPDPPSLEALRHGASPFVLADHNGLIVAINAAFQQIYGWSETQLRGQPLSVILPEAFRMSHQLGFSRFQASETSTILAHPLRLKTICQDGSEIVSEHFIIAEKQHERWLFGATLTPLPEGTPAEA
jgi:PAS domain S-box-containing protein